MVGAAPACWPARPAASYASAQRQTASSARPAACMPAHLPIKIPTRTAVAIFDKQVHGCRNKSRLSSQDVLSSWHLAAWCPAEDSETQAALGLARLDRMLLTAAGVISAEGMYAISFPLSVRQISSSGHDRRTHSSVTTMLAAWKCHSTRQNRRFLLLS
jgi:hypothetical protein